LAGVAGSSRRNPGGTGRVQVRAGDTTPGTDRGEGADSPVATSENGIFETCTHLKAATSRCGRCGSPHLSASIRARTECHLQRSEGIQELGVIGVPRLESSEIKRRHHGLMLTPVHRSRFHVGVEKRGQKGVFRGGSRKVHKNDVSDTPKWGIHHLSFP